MTIESLAARLREAESDPNSVADYEWLRDCLVSRDRNLIRRAAVLVGEQRLEALGDAARQAYDALLESPLESDPGCEAKTALCRALWQIEYADSDFFLAGIRYRQFEPVRGGHVDTAAEIRAVSGFALVQESHPQALRELVDLLADSENTARAGAARALAHSGGETGELLMRMKLQLGDKSPEVMGECFSGLLRLNPAENIDRVARFLDSTSEDLCCEAALALGESRHADALPPLCDHADRRQSREFERVLLTAIGLVGQPGSVDYLAGVVTGPDTGSAINAVEALTHCRDHAAIAERLRREVGAAANPSVLRAVEKHFAND